MLALANFCGKRRIKNSGTCCCKKFINVMVDNVNSTVFWFLVSALYVVILLASACCCSLLKPASHAPALFHHNTNLQQLLDLRSNLSAQGISCHMCSGEKQHWHCCISHFLPSPSDYLRGAPAILLPQIHNNALALERT